jgi:hypothetical protein
VLFRSVGLDSGDLFDTISTFDCFGFIIHPVDTFMFELCPSVVDDKMISTFNENIQKLLKSGLKGIKGVSSIDIKSLSLKDVIKYSLYDKDRNVSMLYVAPEALINFPLDEIEKRVGSSIILSKLNTNEPRHLLVEGCIEMDTINKNEELYHYITVKAMPEEKDVRIETFLTSPLFRKDYILSNDPVEIKDKFGIIVAQTIHEFNYYTSLKAKKFSLAYPHIQILCAKMFAGIALRPITPAGFEGTDGVNPLDKLAYQNYTKHISIEPVRELKKYKADGLVSSTLLGSKFGYGTNYARFEINEEARRMIVEECSIAKTEQHYHMDVLDIRGMSSDYRMNDLYQGIDFFGVGQVKHIKSGSVRTLVLEEEIDFSF